MKVIHHCEGSNNWADHMDVVAVEVLTTVYSTLWQHDTWATDKTMCISKGLRPNGSA